MIIGYYNFLLICLIIFFNVIIVFLNKIINYIVLIFNFLLNENNLLIFIDFFGISLYIIL